MVRGWHRIHLGSYIVSRRWLVYFVQTTPTTADHRQQTTNLHFHSRFVLISVKLALAMLREGRNWSGDGTGFIWGHILLVGGGRRWSAVVGGGWCSLDKIHQPPPTNPKELFWLKPTCLDDHRPLRATADHRRPTQNDYIG